MPILFQCKSFVSSFRTMSSTTRPLRKQSPFPLIKLFTFCTSSGFTLSGVSVHHAVGSLSLYSRSKWLTGGKPRQPLKRFSMHCLCLARAFTTGAPRGTSGALHKQLRIDNTELNGWQVVTKLLKMRKEILWQSSVRTMRSRMRGDASKESSHVLWQTIVFFPFIMISEVYSSMARLLSPTYGTYLITTYK